MKIALLLFSLASVGWAKSIPDDVGIKIFNGTDAYPGQFPYMVAIRESRSGELFLGGALIAPNWIITDMAFRVYPDSQVILGLHDFDDFENGGQPEVYDVIQMVWIEEPSGPNNFLLAELRGVVTSGNPYIQTIALAPHDDYDYTGANCYYSGWGYTESGSVGGVLKYSLSNVVGEEDCPVGMNNITEVCVADEYTATCERDEGGPLVCERDGQMYLVGTLKHPSTCEPTSTSLFHRMAH